jgi:4-hydroxy-tetrahydrodipicolinate reductase
VGLQNADVLIDFTRPEGTLAHLAVCAELGVKAVIGTTGFTDAQKAESTLLRSAPPSCFRPT